MLEDYEIGSHNYQYHIYISGAPVDVGDFRVEWDIFYEGTPDYAVHNQYLPVAPELDDGLVNIKQVTGAVMKGGAITNAPNNMEKNSFMESVIYGIKAAGQITPALLELFALLF